jgi:predicted DsbA family dithiol-disulfide isomerase
MEDVRFPVGGVPFFIVNGGIMLSVAQQQEAFLEALGEGIGRR